MTDFKPDCIINLHVEARGKPAKLAWTCSVSHAKRGPLVLARRFLGIADREKAEAESLLFGLRQASRLLQEKVELAATFSLEGKFGETGVRRPRNADPLLIEEASRLWNGFRLRRTSKLSGPEALALREEAEQAFKRRRGE